MNKEYWYMLTGDGLVEHTRLTEAKEALQDKLFWFALDGNLCVFVKLKRKDAFIAELILIKRNICEGYSFKLQRCLC